VSLLSQGAAVQVSGAQSVGWAHRERNSGGTVVGDRNETLRSKPYVRGSGNPVSLTLQLGMPPWPGSALRRITGDKGHRSTHGEVLAQSQGGMTRTVPTHVPSEDAAEPLGFTRRTLLALPLFTGLFFPPPEPYNSYKSHAHPKHWKKPVPPGHYLGPHSTVGCRPWVAVSAFNVADSSLLLILMFTSQGYTTEK
jgi:hypothetical protein